MKMPPTTTDTELLERYVARRDDAAFAELVRRHLPLVLAVGRRRLGGSGLADDAAQQVFLKLSAKAKQVRQLPSLVAWLHRAAVFEAANLARKEARHRRRVERAGELAPGSRFDSTELDRALASLAERDRQVLVLHYVEDLAYADIAHRLGISEAAAQRRGHRALERLARQLGETRCASLPMALAASFSSDGIKVPARLTRRLAQLKPAATLAIPWVPATIAVALAAGGTVAVTRMRDEPPPVVAAARAVEPRATTTERRFRPQTPDEELSDAVREFIARAKVDSESAWAWAREQPEGAVRFLEPAVRALADRDLPAADRLLESIDGLETREPVIRALAASRAEGNFASAIAWLDSLPDPRDRTFWRWDTALKYTNTEHLDHDYAGALGYARTPEVREFLVREACAKFAETDETAIERLAATLEGEERQLAIAHAASLLLQRGDPRGYELLEQTRPDLLPDRAKLALRNPQGTLEWALAQEDEAARHDLVFAVWHEWGRHDARAAADWAQSLDDARRQRAGRLTAMHDTLERMMEQP